MFPPAAAALPQPSGTLVAPRTDSEKKAMRRHQQQQLREILEGLRKRDIEKRKQE